MKELKFDSNDRVLVVAPHPDDESIGCGGLIAKYSNIVDVLFVSNGARGYNEKYPENGIVEVRGGELKQAMEVAKISNYYLLNIQDQTLSESYKQISRFSISKYTYIFVPNRYEYLDDHSCLFHFFKKMKKKQNRNVRIVEYEIWNTIVSPNLFIDISDVQQQKEAMIKQYQSQLVTYDYISMAQGLNKYRGCRYQRKDIECFYLPQKYEIIKQILPYSFKRMIRKWRRK